MVAGGAGGVGGDFLSAEANQTEQNVTSLTGQEGEKKITIISLRARTSTALFFVVVANGCRVKEERWMEKTTQNLISKIR